MTTIGTAKRAGWTKIRVTKLHGFHLARDGWKTQPQATYTEGNRDWTCVKVGNTWYRTDEYTYNGR